MAVYWPSGDLRQRFLRSSTLQIPRAFEAGGSIHASGKRCFSSSRSFRLCTGLALWYFRARRTARQILYSELADILGGRTTFSMALLLFVVSICLWWLYWKGVVCYWITDPAVGIATQFLGAVSDRSMVVHPLKHPVGLPETGMKNHYNPVCNPRSWRAAAGGFRVLLCLAMAL